MCVHACMRMYAYVKASRSSGLCESQQVFVIASLQACMSKPAGLRDSESPSL